MSFEDTFTDTRADRRVRGAQCPVIVIAGTQGGAGATTTALELAEIASTEGGMPRVVLVDARTGRSDIRNWLRTNSKAYSLETARIQNNPEMALIDSGMLNAARGEKVNDVGFGAILTAPIAHGRRTPADTTLRAIDSARYVSDLVIVDTGTVDFSTGSTFVEVFIPLVETGARPLLVADFGQVSINALEVTLTHIAEELSITRGRVFTLINRRDAKYTDQAVSGIINNIILPRSISIGVVPEDRTNVWEPMSSGQIPTAFARLSSACARMLLDVTGRTTFEEMAMADADGGRFMVTGQDYDNQGRTTETNNQSKGRVPWRRNTK